MTMRYRSGAVRASAATGLWLGTALTTGAAWAGGIDRAAQDETIIFQEGNYAEVSLSFTSPDITGTDVPSLLPEQFSYDNVANDFTSVGFGIKYDITDRFSLAFTGAEDFGADLEYGGDPTISLLGGTSVQADTYALSLIGRYKINENFSVHAGIRGDTASAEIGLSGLAYGPVNGYNVEFDDELAFGGLVGAAYEIPEIALRFAVTYNTIIRKEFETTETLNGASLGESGDTTVDLPQSVNIDFQTGIAEDTLLFARIRWVDWSEFEVAPEQFENIVGNGIVSLNDSTTYKLGVGRRFTDRIAGSAAVVVDDIEGDNLVSPLAPTTGFTGIELAGSYRINNVELSAGILYRWLADAKAETGTPDVARAEFEDNTAVSAGVKVGVFF